MTKGSQSLDRNGYDEQADEHDRCQEEYTAERVARRGIFEQQNLSKCPAKAREESSQDNKDEAENTESRFTSDHQNDAYCHCSDDEDQFKGRVFKAEEKGEGKDES